MASSPGRESLTSTAPKEQRPLRVIPYLRVSTDDKGQDPGRQLDVIQAWAARENAELGPAFRDEGVSGDSDPFTRNGFNEAVDEARDKGFNGIVVEAPDRLTRGGPAAWYVAQWRCQKEQRLNVYSADQGLVEQSSFMGELYTTIKVLMAKEWLDRHRKAVKSGMERAKRNGSFIGAKPKPFSDMEQRFVREELAKGPKDASKKGWKGIAHEINRMRGCFEIVDPVQRKRKSISSMTIRRLAKAWKDGQAVQNEVGVEA